MMNFKSQSILEEVRALKEENARAHNFDIALLFKGMKERQEKSDSKVIKLKEEAGATTRQPLNS